MHLDRRISRLLATIAIAFAVLFPLVTRPAHAQLPLPGIDSSLWVLVQDSLWCLRIVGNGDTVPPEKFAPSYEFTMDYDSLGLTIFLFTEVKRNDSLWKLAKWWNGRKVNARAQLLSYNSRTVSVTLHTGDTISFFRYLWWMDPRNNIQDTNNYFALDSLDYAVELVRTGDSTRAALVDSIGILANLQPGRPYVHGMRPLMALVRYSVPPELDGTEAFLRLCVYHRGSGPYWFTRDDEITAAVSNWLNDTNMMRYVNAFLPGSPKMVPPDLRAYANSGEGMLSVASVPSSRDRVDITFTSSPDGGSTTVAIYDEVGNLLFMPYLTATSSGQAHVEYRFERSGTYFVALLHDGHVIATRTVAITK